MTRALASAQLLTLGAALTGPESALSPLPSCPCCASIIASLRVEAHVSAGLAKGHADAVSAAWHKGRAEGLRAAARVLAAAERRAPHVQAERAKRGER